MGCGVDMTHLKYLQYLFHLYLFGPASPDKYLLYIFYICHNSELLKDQHRLDWKLPCLLLYTGKRCSSSRPIRNASQNGKLP